MSDLTADNFGNDGARDYLAMMTAKLVATIREVVGDDDRIAPDEDGESLLMPSVDILALLCERCGAAPPKATTVKQWRDKYLAAFDKGVAKLYPAAPFRADRRRIIDNTFRWLEQLADNYYDT